MSVVAATNRDLKKDVIDGRFREDLLFRLDVISLRVPALRERRGDVELLVQHFLETFAKMHRRPAQAITGEALALLDRYRWPGNVREVRNVVERLVLLGPAEIIRAGDLPAEIRYARDERLGPCPFDLPEEGVDLEAVESGLIRQALERAGGNQSAAARLLGLSRYQLRYRAEKHGLI